MYAFILLPYARTKSNADLRQPRRPAELDHRRDSVFANQAFRQQAEGRTVSVTLRFVSISLARSSYLCRLRDGRSIRTVSALLLQLVQTSAHDVRVEAEILRDARIQALALRRQDSSGDAKPNFLDEKDMEVTHCYRHTTHILTYHGRNFACTLPDLTRQQGRRAPSLRFLRSGKPQCCIPSGNR